jgi:hypothetical protein
MQDQCVSYDQDHENQDSDRVGSCIPQTQSYLLGVDAHELPLAGLPGDDPLATVDDALVPEPVPRGP